MSYWTEVKDVLLKGVDMAAVGIKSGAHTIVEKGKEGIHFAQLKKDLFLEHRKLHTRLADMGDAVLTLYREKKDISGDEQIKRFVDEITAIEAECRRIEGEMKMNGRERKAG